MVSWSCSSILADFVVSEYYFDRGVLCWGRWFSRGFRSTRPDLGEVLGISSADRVHLVVRVISIEVLTTLVLNGCNY